MTKKTKKAVAYKEFEISGIDPWAAQRGLATAIWRVIQPLKHKLPHPQFVKLCETLEAATVAIQELADVHIEPIVYVSYQPGLFEDETDKIFREDFVEHP